MKDNLIKIGGFLLFLAQAAFIVFCLYACSEVVKMGGNVDQDATYSP